MTTVLEPDGSLAGILTMRLAALMENIAGHAGDDRRAVHDQGPASHRTAPARSEALNLMEKRKITSIVVTDEAKGVLAWCICMICGRWS